jgi:alkaline phosphatase D
MRGSDVDAMRTVGVTALYDGQRCVPGSARYFRLHREYDRTGTVDFDQLKPDARYAVRMGSLAIDSVEQELLMSDKEIYDRLPNPEAWLSDLARLPAETSEASFLTFPAEAAQFSFLLGSCRYPGILMMKKRADEIFRAMGDQLALGDADLRPRFVLMVGDQIYADKLNRIIPIARAETAADFHDRYMEAFTSPYFRQLTRSVPTYMILDDHEIEDNWVQGRVRDADKRALFNTAIHAYLSYQWVQGPRTFDKKLYYTFNYGQVPFFVLDERTQRIRDDDDTDLSDNHLLGYPAKGAVRGQLDEFCAWLVTMQKTHQDVPKFVVSSSVFVPNEVADVKKPWRSDSWPAFPNTRRQVLKSIVDNGVQNVVFLCGDVHCSNVAKIEFEKAGGPLPLKAFVVTSSAFYWPFPFADGDPLGFVHDSRAEGDPFDIGNGVTMHYTANGFEQDDNFTRVTVDLAGKKLTVETFSRKGKPLTSNVLALA